MLFFWNDDDDGCRPSIQFMEQKSRENKFSTVSLLSGIGEAKKQKINIKVALESQFSVASLKKCFLDKVNKQTTITNHTRLIVCCCYFHRQCLDGILF